MKNLTQIDSLDELKAVFPDDDSCRKHLEQLRWQGKPKCIRCGNDHRNYFITTTKNHKCSKCQKHFNVKIGTIFEKSHIPLQKWFWAIYLFSSKKSISIGQLSKDIKIQQRSAWLMLKRMRQMVSSDEFWKPREKNKRAGKKVARSTILKTDLFKLIETGKCIVYKTVYDKGGAYYYINENPNYSEDDIHINDTNIGIRSDIFEEIEDELIEFKRIRGGRWGDTHYTIIYYKTKKA